MERFILAWKVGWWKERWPWGPMRVRCQGERADAGVRPYKGIYPCSGQYREFGVPMKTSGRRARHAVPLRGEAG